VYGIGPGTLLDQEILIYMKSQGWPERVQVGLLMGDMMDSIEKKYEEEKKLTAAKLDKSKSLKDAALVGSETAAVPALPKEGEGNKFAGFF